MHIYTQNFFQKVHLTNVLSLAKPAKPMNYSLPQLIYLLLDVL